MIDFDARRVAVRLVLAVALFAGLWTAYAAATKQDGGTTVILIGRSPSELPSQPTISNCVRRFARRAIADGSKIELGMIARAPADMIMTTIPTALTFEERTNPITSRRRRDAINNKVEAAMKRIFAVREPRYSSDLLAATVGVEPILKSASRTSPRRLVVCGDLHQTGSGADFYRMRLTQQLGQELIATLEPHLADLAGVDVTFVPLSDHKARLPAWRERSIQYWWRYQWAPAAHARSAVLVSLGA
jgi:hypothetical protein